MMKEKYKPMNTAKKSGITRLVKMSKILILIFGIASLSCKGSVEIKPRGNNQAKPIYNQAYCENYSSDSIDDIIQNARNAYVLIDPFMEGIADKIPAIKAGNNEVGGYISIGTAEDWREDFKELKPFVVIKEWGNWEGEYFVSDTTGIIPFMKKRIDKLAAWGCDWVEFDNMDWSFDDENRRKYGFKATSEEGIAYYQELCNYVHSKGMKCMAKNTVIDADNFDGVLYESYNNQKDWWDHAGTQSFLDAGKLVIINHYNERQPNKVYKEYMKLYNAGISYICESKREKKYIYYNQ